MKEASGTEGSELGKRKREKQGVDRIRSTWRQELVYVLELLLDRKRECELIAGNLRKSSSYNM